MPEPPKPPKPTPWQRVKTFFAGLHAWAEGKLLQRYYRKKYPPTEPSDELRETVASAIRTECDWRLAGISNGIQAQRSEWSEGVGRLVSVVNSLSWNIQQLREQLDAPKVPTPKPRKKRK